MPAQPIDPKDPNKDWEHKKKVEFKNARAWILKYKESGFSQKILSECGNMKFNHLALITKFLFDDVELQRGNNNAARDVTYCLLHSARIIFIGEILKSSQTWNYNDVTIESFFDKKYPYQKFYEKLMEWEPDRSLNFKSFYLKFLLKEFFGKKNKKRSDIKPNSGEESNKQVDPETRYESPYERYRNILYILIVSVKVHPHKKLIFFHTTLHYLIVDNIDVSAFIIKHLSDNMKKLYTSVYKKEVNEEFNVHLENYYKRKVLISAMGDLYPGQRYKEIVEKAGPQTLFGKIITRLFFLEYHEGYPKNPNIPQIRDLISRWNSNIKTAAEKLLIEKEQELELIDIMKDS